MAPAVFTSARDVGDCSSPRPGRFNTEEIVPIIHWMLVGPQTRAAHCGGEKNLASSGILSPVVQLGTRRLSH
jgi:hypothetical protein